MIIYFYEVLPFPLSASIQFSENMEQGLRELARSQNESLDREMSILQGLALRAGQQGSSSERDPELGSVVKRGEEDSGDEYFLGGLFESGESPNRPGGSHFLPRNFVPVDELPLLESEDPIKRQYAQTEYLDRCGDGKNQNLYFSSGRNVHYADSRIASEENQFRVPQLSGSDPGFALGAGFALGSSHFPVHSGEGGQFGEESKWDPECDTERDEAVEGKGEGQGIPKTYFNQC